VISFTLPATLPSGKDPSVAIGKEVRWFPELEVAEKRIPVTTRNRTPVMQPIVLSLCLVKWLLNESISSGTHLIGQSVGPKSVLNIIVLVLMFWTEYGSK